MTRFEKVTGGHQKVKAARIGREARRACELHLRTTVWRISLPFTKATDTFGMAPHEDAALTQSEERVPGPIAAVGVPCNVVL